MKTREIVLLGIALFLLWQYKKGADVTFDFEGFYDDNGVFHPGVYDDKGVFHPAQ